MEYTGPASLADMQMDLGLNDEEGETEEHWTPWPSSPASEAASRYDGSSRAHPATSCIKRSMDDTSDIIDVGASAIYHAIAVP